MPPESLSIDDFGPLPLVRPSSVPELCDLVRKAAADGQALYPVGGRTMLGLGLPPTKPGVAVDLTGLDRVIDYPARDMTITVQAGIPVERLQAILRAENQRLAVDVALPGRATLGGAIAANASGPRRYGLGTLRDYVIGISAVNDRGEEIKGGGRVVKNVAGYDLMKLFIGSLGTLGIVTQATLKLKPLPEASRLLTLACHDRDLPVVLDRLHNSRTRPVCIDVLNFAAGEALNAAHKSRLLAAENESFRNLVVGYEGSAAAVAWQAQQLRQELPAENEKGLRECSAEEAETLWTALTDFPLRPDAALSFKANLVPSGVVHFCREVDALSPQPLLQAHAGNGIVVGRFPADLTEPQAAAMLTKLLALAAAAQGNLTVTRCPPAWKSSLPVWGRPTGDRELMRAIKNQLDPNRLFNPGRFVDGI